MSRLFPRARVRTHVRIPLAFADGFEVAGRAYSFTGLADGREHIAIGLGQMAEHPLPEGTDVPVPLVRPHSECLTGDVLGSRRCDCGPQLREAVERISDAGGYLLYLRQEGRGIGLYAKLDAYDLQDSGMDTYDANIALGFQADERDYTVAAQMLEALNVSRLALLSNNPDKAAQLGQLGLTITQRVGTGLHVTSENAGYLTTKAARGSHRLDLLEVRRRSGGEAAAG